MVSDLGLFLRKITFFATKYRPFPPFFLPFLPCEASCACFLVRKNGFELRKYGVVNWCRQVAYFGLLGV